MLREGQGYSRAGKKKPRFLKKNSCFSFYKFFKGFFRF